VNWTDLFLGIIALSALLQAAFVVGLAVASRAAHRRLREIEERLAPQIAVGSEQVARLAAAVSAASEDARERALRLDATATRLAEDLGGRMDANAGRVAGLAEETAERLAGRVASSTESGRRPFLRAVALMKALRRGLDVWKGDGGI
jgi:cell division septum initiation protein DivIVA